MDFNADLARKVLDHIRRHPETWDQGSWVSTQDCGTAYCFAGHALVLSGYKPNTYIDAYTGELQTSYSTMVRPDGHAVYVEYEAQELLGIDFGRGTRLFDCNNDLDDLADIVDAYAANPYLPED